MRTRGHPDMSHHVIWRDSNLTHDHDGQLLAGSSCWRYLNEPLHHFWVKSTGRICCGCCAKTSQKLAHPPPSPGPANTSQDRRPGELIPILNVAILFIQKIRFWFNFVLFVHHFFLHLSWYSPTHTPNRVHVIKYDIRTGI